jgi:hypothetical protein
MSEEEIKEVEIEKPIGDFIIENSVGTQRQNGVYYHYSDVCKLLNLQKSKLYSDSEVLDLLLNCPYEFADNIKKWFNENSKK